MLAVPGEEAEQGLAPPLLLFSCLCSTSFLAPSVCTASVPASSVSHPVSTCPEEKSPVFRNQGPDSLCSPGGPPRTFWPESFPLPTPYPLLLLPWLRSGHLTVPSIHSDLPLRALSADLRGREVPIVGELAPSLWVSQQENGSKSLPSLSP